MALQGIWFDGKTSASIPAEIHIDGIGELHIIAVNDQQTLLRAPFSAATISSRIGNTPRYLYFPGGEKFETKNHALVDQWQKKFHPSFWHSFAHQLESHIYVVTLAVIMMVALTWGMIVYGFPAAARYVAFMLPQSVMNTAATQTLQILDKTQLDPSELDEQIQTRVLEHFNAAIEHNKNLHIKVIFRKGGPIGANAFALPDGTILFTDEIVRLSKNDNELLAVLAHEIGHVKYRHSLRAAIQGSIISFGVVMLTGDLSAASNLLATLPVVITTMSYSRDFEREADNNALDFLDANHIGRHYFVDLMERLSYQAECSYLLKMNTGIDNEHKKSPGDEWIDVEANREECDKLIAEHKKDLLHSRLFGYFASHPETSERIEKFK